MQKGIPEDAMIVVELQPIGIQEKTGRFYSMDTNFDEKVTAQEFSKYWQEKVNCDKNSSIKPLMKIFDVKKIILRNHEAT